MQSRNNRVYLHYTYRGRSQYAFIWSNPGHCIHSVNFCVCVILVLRFYGAVGSEHFKSCAVFLLWVCFYEILAPRSWCSKWLRGFISVYYFILHMNFILNPFLLLFQQWKYYFLFRLLQLWSHSPFSIVVCNNFYYCCRDTCRILDSSCSFPLSNAI